VQKLPLFKSSGFSFFSQHSNADAVTTEQGSQWLPTDQLKTIPASWAPTAVGINKVSPDGRWLAINAPWSEVVDVYRLPELKPGTRLRHLGNVADFVFSPDGEQLALTSPKGVQFWRTDDWKLVRTLPDFTGVLFQPNSHPPALWLMKDFRTTGLYEADQLDLLLPLPNGMYPVAISPDGGRLAISVDLRRLQLWDLSQLRQKLRQLGMAWPEKVPSARAASFDRP
jgi:WD40 repeat protein